MAEQLKPSGENLTKKQKARKFAKQLEKNPASKKKKGEHAWETKKIEKGICKR